MNKEAARRRSFLHKAVLKDPYFLKDLLKQGALNADFEVEDGQTGLHLAACNGLIKCASILLNNGANLHAKDKKGFTPIERAALGDHVSMVKLLLNRGANVNDCLKWFDAMIDCKQNRLVTLLLCFHDNKHTRITRAEKEAYYVKNSSDIRKQRIRGITGTHTHKDIEQIWAAQAGKCYFCGISLGRIITCRFHKDHLTPVSKGGTNWPSNIALTCGLCNQRKHGKDEATFWRVLKKEHGAKWVLKRKKFAKNS